MNALDLDALASEVAERYFDYLYGRDLKSERFTRLPADKQREMLANAIGKLKGEIAKIVQRILDRDVRLLEAETFHPSNKMYRDIFSRVTGQTLPGSANETRQVVADYIGSDKLKAAEDARAAVAAEKELAKQAAEAARLASIAKRFDDQITGQELLDLARHHGIEVHPRTAGMLKSRVLSIGRDQARVTGRPSTGNAFAIRKRVAEKLLEAR